MEKPDFDLDPPLLPNMFRFHLRMPKEESAFVYFVFEANEGICYYSTLEHKQGDRTRDLVLRGDRTMHSETKRLLQFLLTTIPGLEILEENLS